MTTGGRTGRTARIGPGGPGGPVFGYHGNGFLSFLYGDFYFAVIFDNPIVTSTSYDWVVRKLICHPKVLEEYS